MWLHLQLSSIMHACLHACRPYPVTLWQIILMIVALCVVIIVFLLVRHCTSKAVAKEAIAAAGTLDTVSGTLDSAALYCTHAQTAAALPRSLGW